jgi:hypothetical protein
MPLMGTTFRERFALTVASFEFGLDRFPIGVPPWPD